MGLRWLAMGNGGADSLFLTVSAGGAGLSGQVEEPCEAWEGGSDRTCTHSVSYGGPMVGFGVELRR